MKQIKYTDCLSIQQELLTNAKTIVMSKYRITRQQCNRILNGYFDVFGIINNNTTILRKIPIDELKELIVASYSYSEVIRKCNLDVRVSYIRTLKKIITQYDIEVSHFVTDFGKFLRGPELTNQEIFTKVHRCGSTLKRRILRDRLIEYKCAECPNEGTHNGKLLVLQLDHINGDNSDNRLENLRFICPNCHSQTSNFTGKNIALKIKHCSDCGGIIRTKRIRCEKCSEVFRVKNIKKINSTRILKFDASKEVLEKLVDENPMSEIGKMFGVSDTAVKKRCRKLGIELKPMRGYWSKLRSVKT